MSCLHFKNTETKQCQGFLHCILLENTLCVLAAHPSYQKSRMKGLFSNSPGQRLQSCQENGIQVYRAAREYGVPQSVLKDRVHIVHIGRNVVATPANSFFIGSSSFLQVTSTCMKTWMSLNFCQIPPLTSDFNILSCGHSSAFIFDWIFFILSGKEDNHRVWTECEFRVDRIKGSGVSCS